MLRLWKKFIRYVMRDRDQLLPLIPCGILKQVSDPSERQCEIHASRVFYAAAGIILGIYLSSTPAVAEVEEVGKDIIGSSSSLSTLPGDLSVDLFTGDDGDLPDMSVIKFQPGDDIIPKAVWNLNKSTNINFNLIRDGVSVNIYTGTTLRSYLPQFWIRSAFGVWARNSSYTSGSILPPVPIQFQVASCGGSHAEHRDLDYCSIRDNVLMNNIEQMNSSDTNGGTSNTLDDAANAVIYPKNVSSSSNPDTQSTPPSLSTPTPVSNPPPQGELIALDPCDGASGGCAIADNLLVTPIDLPTVDPSPSLTDDLATAIDIPAPLTDLLTPPPNLLIPVAAPLIQVASLDDPGSESDLPPLLPPGPLKPIPEASTWVMTVIGFGIIALMFRRKKNHRINPISIIDISGD